LLLPYIPFLAGAFVLASEAWASSLDRVIVVAGGVLIGLVLARQLLTLVENNRLVETVQLREEELRHQAFHDPLTGLANRLLFNDRMEHQVSLRRSLDGKVTVLFVDLDDFKNVNDEYGHATGDALLLGVAERLRASLRVGDTVARLGGDEFAVLLAEDDEPALVAQRILHSLDVPFQFGSHRVRVSASVGAASLSTDGVPERVAEELLRSADVAMYAAKRGRKGSYVLFSSGMTLVTDGPPTQRHGVPSPR
jgi:diguanylate cyclase (GGDEF)-like protein